MSAAAEPLASTRLSRNTVTLLISNLGSAPFAILLSVLIGRMLGTEGLGAYAVAAAWVLPLSQLVEFGLGTLMQRDLAADASRTRITLEIVSLSRIVLGGTVMLALILVAPYLSNDPQVIAGLRISAPIVMILPLVSNFTAVYKARGVMWPLPYLNIGMLAIQTMLTAIALFGGGDLVAVLVINLVTSAGQLVAAYAIYRWKFEPPQTVVSTIRQITPMMLPILRRAFPFALAALFAALQARLSVILLEQLATTAEVGYFSAASRFVEAARLIPNAFFGALLPALAALAANRVLMRQTFRRGMIGLGALGIAAGIGFSLLALPLVILIYGAAFAPAAPVLQVLGWSVLFSNLRGARTLYLYALGQEWRVNRVNGAVLLVQGGLSLLLIPPLGALGVALVYDLVEIAALALLWRDDTRRLASI